MNESRYRQLRKQFRESGDGTKSGGPNDKEIVALAEKSKDSLERSLSMIRGVLEELKFDLERSSLLAIVVQKPGELETKWIMYRDDDPRVRLDIRYIIESEGNIAIVKLNDAFLIDGKRYLARGFYLRAYRPNEHADGKVKRAVRRYSLRGIPGAIEKLLKELEQKPTS